MMEGRMLSDFGVTTLPSLVTKMKFAPPVSSTLVLVAASRYMFSSKPWLMCLHDGIKAHSIVQSCFDVTGSVRCCTVIIADADGDGFCAALEVRANRGGEYTELIFLSGFYTDDSAASEHIRTDV